MRQDNIHPLQSHPRSLVEDPLTELVRQGARKRIEEALQAELQLLFERVGHLTDDEGRQRLVRNGYLPEREVQTGIGPVTVKVPRVRDRATTASKKIRFTSKILPKYMRKTRSLEALIPWLYLKGVSTGAFSEALAALVGTDAPGLSQATISRLKAVWKVRRLAEARPLRQALRLFLGRRHLLQHPHGPARAGHPRAHRRYRRGAQGFEGTRGHRRRLPRVGTVLARAALGPEDA